MSADLASISSQEEMNFVASITPESSYWIGLRKMAATEWYDGNTSPYRPWAPGEPYSSDECIIHSSSGLRDMSCSQNYHFVCKKAADPTSLCENPWTHDSGSCYRASNQAKTQASARSRCQNHGADLVSISDENEKNYVAGLLSGEDFWIGLHKVTRWYDGNPSTYRNWRLSDSEPNESSVCVRYKEGFRDKQCDETYRYICKKASDGGSCESGWSIDNNNCYKLISHPRKNQWEARSECHSRDAQLVSITDQDEMDFVAEMTNHDIWIGLYKATDTEWYDGNSSPYRNWAPTEPRTTGKCVRFTDNGFQDDNCDDDNYYICKKDAGNQ